MHSYCIDTNERKNVILMIVIISIVLNMSLIKYIDGYNIIIPWWIESPSVFLVYGILYKFFDKKLWLVLQSINIIKTPNLNGQWIGFIQSSFNDYSSKKEAVLHIYQTWTAIKLVLNTEQSESKSESASILINFPECKYLTYHYINTPKPLAENSMHTHLGTTKLKISKDKNELNGEYYTGRDRNNIGIINFKLDLSNNKRRSK